ncbi:MAG: PTS sugar transporter subunit IIA [Verrucomicrobia bacterium]|nr:PTS sugar transporter subunit IIA [bacterium]NDA10176.1 PTS sugar transporter subunit IIA [Verrucomicrobiota bacterium]NDA25948.1 PTS sugar transporter subunit IIA [Verrucomicrobiota bacterium]NDD56905.1 PTS sugar transporter subunit IIA [Verrucomicrobiota bacterium]NDD81861.1 PTS sugar transporter subunit IIA [Verrucomicrobiota bacterium]
MLISDLIQEDNLMAHLEAKDRPQAHLKMLQHLVEKGFISKDLLAPTEKALQAREDKLTTAMGGGFAIPHATIPKLGKLVTLFARCPAGVDCAAMDGKPVKMFFLILVPGDQAQAHLQTLATVAKFFNRRGVKTKILEAKGGADILAIFRAT